MGGRFEALIPAAILTGGRSVRMGQPAALLPVDGRPMAVHIAERAAAAGCSPVVFVGGLPSLSGHGFDVLGDDASLEHHPLRGISRALGLASLVLTIIVIIKVFFLLGRDC